MRYIKGLNKDTLKLLKRIYQQSKYYQVRQRAHCIKLSYQGYKISELREIFQVSRNTIYNWFNAWESSKFSGLYNSPGRGRKKLFTVEQQQQIKNWVKDTPKNLEKVQSKILREWGNTVSKKTIKRIIKSAYMGWSRIKRRVGGNPIPEFYDRKVKELDKLKEQESTGEIEIRYVDESGFCLIPYIPYAWQERKQKIEVPSQQSKRLNVLGFLSRQNELEVYTFKCSINSDVIVACIDQFCEKITKKTILIMDNASIHQNNFLWNKEAEWSEKGLEIFFLPTYSPHLNIIEILWRFIKYKWLESDAYESYSALVDAVENILKNFGTEYTINFV
ncbi:IS630 family transposase [Pleurocapsa sp. PCC 7319]|uniref:IS630 family transposase n=1 Tax=Pleurocapsa sp. PCC 7319 TaxID=118161 RepID=UPI0003477BB9|nr:IS630 family transposase [Pleurocapsa sp. PCC 7319]